MVKNTAAKSRRAGWRGGGVVQGAAGRACHAAAPPPAAGVWEDAAATAAAAAHALALPLHVVPARRSYAKGFAAMGALFAGTECLIGGCTAGCGQGPQRLPVPCEPSSHSSPPPSSHATNPPWHPPPLDQRPESYRAKHDARNSVYAGCATGAILAHSGGPKAMCIGCASFAAFSALIDRFWGH